MQNTKFKEIIKDNFIIYNHVAIIRTFPERNRKKRDKIMDVVKENHQTTIIELIVMFYCSMFKIRNDTTKRSNEKDLLRKCFFQVIYS